MRDSYTNRNHCVVVWEGWSLVRVVVRQGFYCSNINFYGCKVIGFLAQTFSVHQNGLESMIMIRSDKIR